MRFLCGVVSQVLAERNECKIIDVGGTAAFWRTFAPDLVDDPRVHFTLTNIRPDVLLDEDAQRFGQEVGDARAMPHIADRSYDVAHSNSVIEHVGRWVDMISMAAEMQRIGRIYFVQTPYWGFPVEPHNRTPFFHWLPEQWRYRLVMRFKLGFWGRVPDVSGAMRAVQSNALLDRLQFEALFPEATIYSERAYGLTKSLIAVGGEGQPKDSRSNRASLTI